MIDFETERRNESPQTTNKRKKPINEKDHSGSGGEGMSAPRKKFDAVETLRQKEEFKVVNGQDAEKIAQAAVADLGEKWKPVHAEIVSRTVEAQQKTAEAAICYMELCVAIHNAKLLPKTARALMLAGGLPPSRASEILSVAGASPAIFRDYVKRLIGFKSALEQARGEKRQQQPLLLEDGPAKRLAPLLAELLGDKRKIKVELDGVTMILSRKKPAPELGV